MSIIRDVIDLALDANKWAHSLDGPPNPPYTGPFLSARALAIVFRAMHDAHAFVVGRPVAGMKSVAPAGTADAARAAGAAGASALMSIYATAPRELFDRLEARWRSMTTTYVVTQADHAVGETAANLAVRSRRDDATYFDVPTTDTVSENEGPNRHAADPYAPRTPPRAPSFTQGTAGKHWGAAPRFAVPLQAMAAPYPDGSNDLIAEFAEVNAFGREDATVRTSDQTRIGIYWGYDGAFDIGTPPRLYIQVILAAVAQYSLSEAELLDLLDAVGAALGDAGIQAWHYKYVYDYWRPVVALRATPGATTWRPLGRPDTNRHGRNLTPNFPAYPSGHATFGAAALQITRRFLHHHGKIQSDPLSEVDSVSFEFVSDEYDGDNVDPITQRARPRTPVHFASLWQAIVENSESRIWLGVHWRMDGISVKNGNGTGTHGSPASPAEVGPVGGVHLGFAIANAIAEARWGARPTPAGA